MAEQALLLIEQPLLQKANQESERVLMKDQQFMDRIFVLLLVYCNYGKALKKLGLKTNQIFRSAATMGERLFGKAHYLTKKLAENAEKTRSESMHSRSFSVKNQKSIIDQHQAFLQKHLKKSQLSSLKDTSFLPHFESEL